MKTIPPITIERMLRDQLYNYTRDIRPEVARAVVNMLPSRRTLAHSLVLHLCANGIAVNASEYLSARSKLLEDGLLYSVDTDKRGSNNKLMKEYRLTDKGEDAHAEILAIYGPFVERMNKSMEAAALV